jgi:hypothetical protein
LQRDLSSITKYLIKNFILSPISVAYDKEKNDYIGLPEEWRSLLEENKIR